MKRMLAKSMRSVLALLLVGCLVFGMCGTALAAEAECPAERVEALIEELAAVIMEYVPKALQNSYDFAAAQVDPVLDAAAALKAKLDTKAEIADVLDRTVSKLAKVASAVDFEEVEATLEEAYEATAELYDAVKDDPELLALYDQLMIEIENLITFFKLAYKRATSADLKVTGNTSYVAIGDDTAAAEKDEVSYVNKLAAELKIKNVTNLADEDMMVEDAYDVIAENAAVVEAADLITVGFNSNNFVEFTLDKVLAGEHDVGDWVPYVTEAGAEAIGKIVAELKDEFTQMGLGKDAYTGMDYALILTLAIESYAYSCAAYAFNMPLLLNDISNMNEDAVVVIVGMYNPLKGVSLNVGGASIPMGVFVETLVETTDIYNLTYAMLTCNGIFANMGNKVTTVNGKADLALFDLINTVYNGGMEPNAAGHTEIKDRIMDCLRTKDVLWGDVNHDGEVNAIDAMLILQYAIDDIGADGLDLDVADVSDDGEYNAIDAMLILQRAIDIIDIFPVEK